MEITREVVDGMLEKLNVTIENADYQEKVVKELKKIRQNAEIPGFRRGNAPMPLIEKKYKGAIQFEVIEKFISESVEAYIKENHIDLLINMQPHEEDFEHIAKESGNLVFHFDMVVTPDMDVQITKEDQLTMYEISLTEADIDKKVEEYRTRFGSRKEVDSIEDNDQVYADFAEVNAADGGQPQMINDAPFLMAFVQDEDIKKQLLGKKVGETLVFSPKKAFKEDAEVAYLLQLTRDDPRLQSEYNCTIKKIMRTFPAELNDDFFAKFGKGIEGIQGVKDKIRESEKFKNDYMVNRKFASDVHNLLLDKYKDIKLPEDFLCNYLVKDKNIGEEGVKQHRDEYMNEYRREVIVNNLGKKNDITVSEEDIKNISILQTRMMFMSYGMEFMDDQQIADFALNRLQKDDMLRLYSEAQYQKIADLFKTQATVTTEVVSLEEFLKK